MNISDFIEYKEDTELGPDVNVLLWSKVTGYYFDKVRNVTHQFIVGVEK